jgi:beta-lactamase superfamily II metal-dependent hydrolase
MVISTHPDADHLAGLVSLPDRYEVEQALVSDVEGNSQLYQEWETELAEDQLIRSIGQVGTQLVLGNGVVATILNPSPAIVHIDEPNNHSLVLHLQFGQVSFLLPGDIEAPIERRLVQANFPLNAP